MRESPKINTHFHFRCAEERTGKNCKRKKAQEIWWKENKEQRNAEREMVGEKNRKNRENRENIKKYKKIGKKVLQK